MPPDTEIKSRLERGVLGDPRRDKATPADIQPRAHRGKLGSVPRRKEQKEESSWQSTTKNTSGESGTSGGVTGISLANCQMGTEQTEPNICDHTSTGGSTNISNRNNAERESRTVQEGIFPRATGRQSGRHRQMQSTPTKSTYHQSPNRNRKMPFATPRRSRHQVWTVPPTESYR